MEPKYIEDGSAPWRAFYFNDWLASTQNMPKDMRDDLFQLLCSSWGSSTEGVLTGTLSTYSRILGRNDYRLVWSALLDLASDKRVVLEVVENLEKNCFKTGNKLCGIGFTPDDVSAMRGLKCIGKLTIKITIPRVVTDCNARRSKKLSRDLREGRVKKPVGSGYSTGDESTSTGTDLGHTETRDQRPETTVQPPLTPPSRRGIGGHKGVEKNRSKRVDANTPDMVRISAWFFGRGDNALWTLKMAEALDVVLENATDEQWDALEWFYETAREQFGQDFGRMIAAGFCIRRRIIALLENWDEDAAVAIGKRAELKLTVYAPAMVHRDDEENYDP